MRKMKSDEVIVDFSYYMPINKKQEEFHKSNAMHKLLIGAYRSGKTYPAIHEAFFVCYDNSNHEFLVARNTWDSLTENIEKDMLRISERANAHKKWDKSKHDLYLHNGTVIRFRPLTMTRAQFKGMNLCGFLIDDPDVDKYKEVISFLYTRLTNPPNIKANYFETIICANYEGHNWLWQQYMRRRPEGGDGMFAYWIMKTEDNPTILPDYIKTLAAIHSRAWMDRYVYAKIDAYSGLVYDEYNPQYHDADLSWCFNDNNLIKVLVIDCGITHPTVVLKMATDYQNIYVYDEWYQVNIRTHDLGKYLRNELEKDNYYKILIDPKSAAKEQTSGTSPKNILWEEFGIRTMPANNNLNFGIEVVKGLLTIRDSETHLYIDPKRCPNTVREIEMYKWKEPEMADFDEVAFKEEPIKKDDDCMDCIRYGCVFLRKFLKGIWDKENIAEKRREQLWKERYEKLKVYRELKFMRNKNELRRIKEIDRLGRLGLLDNSNKI